MGFNRERSISTLSGEHLKLVDKFTYLVSSVSSTERDVNIRLSKTWTAIDWLSIICYRRDLMMMMMMQCESNYVRVIFYRLKVQLLNSFSEDNGKKYSSLALLVFWQWVLEFQQCRWNSIKRVKASGPSNTFSDELVCEIFRITKGVGDNQSI